MGRDRVTELFFDAIEHIDKFKEKIPKSYFFIFAKGMKDTLEKIFIEKQELEKRKREYNNTCRIEE